MINPTNAAGAQFTSPFNITPDVIYTSPVVPASPQFVSPFNITPDLMYTSPVVAASSQFIAPFNITPDPMFFSPAFAAFSQFNAPFDILPNKRYDSIVLDLKYAQSADQFTRQNNPVNVINASWRPVDSMNSSISIASQLAALPAQAIASQAGIPQVSQVVDASINMVRESSKSGLSAPYSTLPLDKLHKVPFIKLSDFRSRTIANIRLDGASSLTRRGWLGGIYAAASITPAGPYSIFNLDGMGDTGYGWGDHGNPYAIRNDFTMRSHIATRWSAKDNMFKKTLNPIDLVVPFRGDRVNVIDFSKRTEKEAYLWNPIKREAEAGTFGAFLNKAGLTQDFIKFYMTGPKLVNNAANNITDDIIVFRATLGSLSDSFQANWTPVQMIGRADPNYHYTGYNRDISLDFTVYATDRDELQPIWRKLNALAGYTAPTYTAENIAMQAPWMRITIGDLFRQQPVILTSLDYTLSDTDTTWEINIEQDPTMMQVPHKISVRCSFTMIGDYLPQQGGKFYTLAKKFDDAGLPMKGNDNWLSDSESNSDITRADLKEQRKAERKIKKANKEAYSVNERTVEKAE
jgi:hypothetical protein